MTTVFFNRLRAGFPSRLKFQRLGSETLLETDDAGAALAVDGDGRITAVWAQSNGAEDSLYANRFQ